MTISAIAHQAVVLALGDLGLSDHERRQLDEELGSLGPHAGHLDVEHPGLIRGSSHEELERHVAGRLRAASGALLTTLKFRHVTLLLFRMKAWKFDQLRKSAGFGARS